MKRLNCIMMAAVILMISMASNSVQAGPLEYICVGPCLGLGPVPIGGTPSVLGQLVNILDVPIGGDNYDVAFVYGTFDEVFGTSTPALLFTTETQARNASQALSDILVDNSFGDFDSSPFLTRGCSSNQGCQNVTPYEVADNGWEFRYVAFENASPLFPTLQDRVWPSDGSIRGARAQDNLFAVWRLHDVPFIDPQQNVESPINRFFDAPSYGAPAPAPVPEPATMLLMGSGLAGLIGARRKKKA